MPRTKGTLQVHPIQPSHASSVPPSLLCALLSAGIFWLPLSSGLSLMCTRRFQAYLAPATRRAPRAVCMVSCTPPACDSFLMTSPRSRAALVAASPPTPLQPHSSYVQPVPRSLYDCFTITASSPCVACTLSAQRVSPSCLLFYAPALCLWPRVARVPPSRTSCGHCEGIRSLVSPPAHFIARALPTDPHGLFPSQPNMWTSMLLQVEPI